MNILGLFRIPTAKSWTHRNLSFSAEIRRGLVAEGGPETGRAQSAITLVRVEFGMGFETDLEIEIPFAANEFLAVEGDLPAVEVAGKAEELTEKLSALDVIRRPVRDSPVARQGKIRVEI